MRLIKVLLVLAVLGFAALSAYAYLGEFRPDASTHSAPATLPSTENGN